MKMNHRVWGGFSIAMMLLLAPASMLANNLQICKLSDETSPVTGSFQFTVVGKGDVSIKVGDCANFLEIGEGTFTIIEKEDKKSTLIAIAVDPAAALVG